MGGNEGDPAGRFRFESLGLSETDLANFAATGVDVSALRGARLRYDQNKKGEFNFNGVYSADGKDIRSLVDQYSAWAGKQSASKLAQEAYVKAKLDSPGRDATLLVPGSEKLGKSLIGG